MHSKTVCNEMGGASELDNLPPMTFSELNLLSSPEA